MTLAVVQSFQLLECPNNTVECKPDEDPCQFVEFYKQTRVFSWFALNCKVPMFKAL